MVNYYQGFRRIWILLWVISSLALLITICISKEPNPVLPFASIHPEGSPKPIIEPFEEQTFKEQLDDYNDPGGFDDAYRDGMKKEHEKQMKALYKWKSELIPALHIKSYWKNVRFTFLSVGAWSVLFWCVWLIGVWIVRGFKPKPETS
jgi:hypothetical protein